jgi:hypothetical protein
MSKHKQSWITDLFIKTSKPTEPETLTEDDSEAFDSSAECDDTLPHDYKMGQSYEKKFKWDWPSKPVVHWLGYDENKNFMTCSLYIKQNKNNSFTQSSMN